MVAKWQRASSTGGGVRRYSPYNRLRQRGRCFFTTTALKNGIMRRDGRLRFSTYSVEIREACETEKTAWFHYDPSS